MTNKTTERIGTTCTIIAMVFTAGAIVFMSKILAAVGAFLFISLDLTRDKSVPMRIFHAFILFVVVWFILSFYGIINFSPVRLEDTPASTRIFITLGVVALGLYALKAEWRKQDSEKAR